MPLRWIVRLIWLGFAGAVLGAALLYVPDLGAKPLRESLDDCRLIRTNKDGTRLFLCPPVAAATPTHHAATATPAAPTPTAAAPKATVAAPGPTSPAPGGSAAPYPGAPPCPDHPITEYHGLWDAARGCHYDHEHGDNPFTAAVAAAFPGLDLRALQGGMGTGHTNPTSEMEFTHKHGGLKWQVSLGLPCVGGFEGAQWCVTDAVLQYHAFGNYAIEFESRVHSTAALLKVCDPANPGDCGVMFVVMHQDYGQRVSCYQGQVLPYPDTPNPGYESSLGPYLTLDSTGPSGCRESLEQVRPSNLNANSIWTSKGGRTGAQNLFNLLFRVRDSYQLLDTVDLEYPFIFNFVCGGAAYDPAGCRYNNSTTRVHEVGGVIPAEWGAGAGRVTLDGYVNGLGQLVPECAAPGPGCFPLKLINVPVGAYGSELTAGKVSNPDPVSNPERDIYFCAGLPCAETDPGAVPSGWIGENN
jgi:hypothetical protein